MAINPKLEFYRFTLNHKKKDFKTFRDFAIEELKAGKNPSNEKVTEVCFKHFIQSLKTDFAKDDKLKKKICFEKKKSINKHFDKGPSFNSSDHTIFGVINGGLYGRDRIISNNDDEDDSFPLDLNKSVLQYYFFYLYIPSDHNEGFFMIHSNGKEETITNIFRSYITNIFRGNNYNKAQPTEFCPKSFQDEFLKGAILKSMSFKTTFMDDLHTTDGISKLFQHYDIKIEAVPKSKDITGTAAEGFLSKLQAKLFGTKNKEKKLEDFDETKMVLESDISGSTKTFEWNTKDNDFVPVVYLKGRVDKKNADGTPDFEELKSYCNTIFTDEILPEIRPDLYVTKAK